MGKSLADAATCEVVDVLIFKIVDTDKVEAGGIDFVADFLFDAQVLWGTDAEDSSFFDHLVT